MGMSASISIENVLLPSFVTSDPTNNAVSCSCRGCGTSPALFDTLDGLEDHLRDQLNIFWFDCPVPNCTKVVPTLAGTITAHIKEAHPKIASSMNLNTRGRTAIYCKDCDRYSTRLHYHCYECENECEHDKVKKFFLSKEERDAHLSTEHTKWFLEHICKFKKACHGCASGACGFNHLDEKRFIAAGEDIPDTVCSFDQPWANKRCTKIRCPKDHFWGRVRFLIAKQKKFGRSAKVAPAPAPVAVPEPTPEPTPEPCTAAAAAEPEPTEIPSLADRVNILLSVSTAEENWAMLTCSVFEELEDGDCACDLTDNAALFDQMRQLVNKARGDATFAHCYLSAADNIAALLDGIEERSATEARLLEQAMAAAVAEAEAAPAPAPAPPAPSASRNSGRGRGRGRGKHTNH